MKPQYSFSARSKSKSNGFTLIELLVALVLGLFLVGGVISIFVSNQQNYKSNENLARIQENARFAVEQIGRSIRDAGITPCGVRTVNSVLRTDNIAAPGTPWWANWNAGTIVGYDGSQALAGYNGVPFGASANDRVTNTDAISVLRAGMDDGVLHTVQSHSTVAATVTLDRAPSTYRDGDAVVLCDGNSAAIFQLTEAPAGAVIEYSDTATVMNCSTQLGWTSTVNCNLNSTFKQFATGSFVTTYDPAFWYIGNSDLNGGRSLYRTSMTRGGRVGNQFPTATRQEMVPDVSNMQIEYLTRQLPAAPPTPPGGTPVIPDPILATTWVNAADAKFSAANFGWSTQNIEQVVAVRVTLTLTSKENVGTNAAATSAERLNRQVVAVFSLRNREPVR